MARSAASSRLVSSGSARAGDAATAVTRIHHAGSFDMRDTLAHGSEPGAQLQRAVAALQAAGSTGNLDLREDGGVQSRRFAVTTIVAWSVIALVSAAEMYAYAQRSPPPISMWHALAIHIPGWAVFALATRPVVALSRRFALDWPLRARAIAVHVAACAAAPFAFSIAYTGAIHAFPRET